MNRGVSLYLTIIIMSILLAIVLGLSAILVGQMKMLKGMENSVIAFYAADTGIERVLSAIRKEGYNPNSCTPTPCETSYADTLANGANYKTYIESLGPPVKIKSIGTYQETKRAIEISY